MSTEDKSFEKGQQSLLMPPDSGDRSHKDQMKSLFTDLVFRLKAQATRFLDLNFLTSVKRFAEKIGNNNLLRTLDKMKKGETDPHPQAAPPPAQEKESSSLQPQSEMATSNFNILQMAYSYIAEIPRSVIVSSFFINILGLALPIVILQVYDRIIPNQSVETLTLLILGLAAVIVVEAVMKISRSYLMGWEALNNSFEIETEAVKRMLKSPVKKIDRDPPGVWMDRLDALTELNSFYGGPSRLILLDVPFIMIFLLIITLVGGVLVFVPIIVIALFATYTVIRGKRLQVLLKERAAHDGRRFDFIIECLEGIQTIKSMAMEPQIQRRFERLQKSTAKMNFNTILFSSHIQSVSGLFASVMMVSVVTVGAMLAINGMISIGTLACCSLLSGRVVQPVLRSIGIWAEMQNVTIAYDRAKPLFNLEKPELYKGRDVSLKGAITIRDLSYAHDKKAEPVINHLSLSVKAGEIIGLRGADGAGKSTLIKLIRGELPHDKGSIYIDGQNAIGAAYQELAKSIFYVSDEGDTFSGTILENITMFQQGDIIDIARKSCSLIGLEDDIQRLPEGYDTLLGQGISDALPQGLIQRIVIARVLAQKPKILLFDEANAMLDYRSDALLRNGLDQLKGKMTILLISNRPSLLDISDRVYELKEGRLEMVEGMGKDHESHSIAQQDTQIA